MTVTYAVHVTKNGKKAVYYKFKTAKHTVWTWRGALKRVSSSKVSTKTSTKTNAKTSTATTPTTTTPASNNNVGSTAERNQTFSMNLRDYQRGFLDTVNQERTQRGTSPLAEDSALDGVTATRANEILTHYSHDDTDGNTAFIHECDAAGIDYDTAEVLGFSMINAVYHTANSDNTSTSSETFNITVNNSYNAGKAMVLEYIYYDATSDWGHRDALLNPANNVIGIGAQYAASHGSYRPSVANAAILGAK
ncbi:CAP domain-containing protein [Levilactobacillus cerevisiae]|uniref:CAP domain-containing protein n=1 Tax=Levilactobacillus cerevisiae TaxID=1704076 RepID=UPI000F7858D1|nr:CAP domain-containing protein [Levilactobacillus cerevisiae]